MSIIKKFFKKDNKTNNKVDEYEEISEKKTSKLGYVLLAILAVFLVIIGQKIFSDVEGIPKKPIHPTYSIERYLDADSLRNITYLPMEYYSPAEYKVKPLPIPIPQPAIIIEEPVPTLEFAPTLEFNDTDKKFEIDKKFKAIEPELNIIISLNRDINDIKDKINFKEAELDDLLMKYNVSLQEVIAREEALMDKPSIKTSIISLNSELSLLSQKLTNKNIERENNINLIKPKLTLLETAYEQAVEYYKDCQARYNFIVFLLKLLFVLPLFIISLYFYFRLKRKDSPHTIIAATVVAASSILFIQIVLVFLYQILPIEWLKRIFRILMEITVLKYVLYYGSALLVIAIFGGVVYYIQKKVFNPKIVAVRRLKDNKCPNCSFVLNLSYDFCPKCGRQLKEKCPNCGNLKTKDLPYCPFCGKK